jgi:hypothetical protein
MKILEITESAETIKPSPEFIQAVEDWQSMYHPDQAAKIILNSPEAQPFMRAPYIPQTDTLFRAVRAGRFPRVSKGPVVAYAWSASGAYAFVHTLDVRAKWRMAVKEFNPGDFLLNFTDMIHHYKRTGGRYIAEDEVWMKPTPYYTTVDETDLRRSFRS